MTDPGDDIMETPSKGCIINDIQSTRQVKQNQCCHTLLQYHDERSGARSQQSDLYDNRNEDFLITMAKALPLFVFLAVVLASSYSTKCYEGGNIDGFKKAKIKG
ncbi:hypothetical protein LSH36_661g01024 [Paralvinella palmiformis]|uniref:Uncharacterized protein n=1 Tax=Paralvinella palmiformis TaxID=53620 RepID=A0AAD9MWL8_9ANNE|nr:hypothetical protein LSH36_661g01024 [Paralvinella palmiformis]